MAGGGLLTSNTLTCSSTPLPLLRILVIPSGPLGLSRIIYLKVSWRHRAGTWTQQGRRAGTSWGQHWHLHTATREAEPMGARCDHGGAGPGADPTGRGHGHAHSWATSLVWITLSSLQNLEPNLISHFFQQSKKLDQDQCDLVIFFDSVIYRKLLWYYS